MTDTIVSLLQNPVQVSTTPPGMSERCTIGFSMHADYQSSNTSYLKSPGANTYIPPDGQAYTPNPSTCIPPQPGPTQPIIQNHSTNYHYPAWQPPVDHLSYPYQERSSTSPVQVNIITGSVTQYHQVSQTMKGNPSRQYPVCQNRPKQDGVQVADTVYQPPAVPPQHPGIAVTQPPYPAIAATQLPYPEIAVTPDSTQPHPSGR